MPDIPFFSLQKQSATLKQEVLNEISTIIDQTDFVLGEKLTQFEQAFAQYCQSKHCLSVSNGTTALLIAIKALGIKTGDEVILPAATFTSTALAVVYAGATPVFVDIDEKTWLLSPSAVKEKITSKTKAIIAVHLYGSVCDMDELLTISEKYDIPIIEDAAQAQGAVYKNRKVGSFGAMGCFSFYPSKNLGAMGDAGAIVFNDSAYYNPIAELRNVGKNEDGVLESLGFNFRLSTIQGAVLQVKLPHLDTWNARRREIAARYKTEINNPKIQWQHIPDEVFSVYHHFEIKTDHRDTFLEYAKRNGLGFGIHYDSPVHLLPAYQGYKVKKGSLPVSEYLFSRCVSLPIYPEMPKEHVDQVIEIVNAY